MEREWDEKARCRGKARDLRRVFHMCGLTGFLQPPGSAEAELSRQLLGMANTLRHRGPDDWGAWVDPAVGIALGFRRLAILDLSPTGHQPMRSADGRRVVFFNGEIQNFRELRAELQALGALCM